ncbi:hypothetical protein TURU_013816 [Turdus rufiventris]|nr:hypothetical protein TURU_013816 [Turdus rufiventris]
MEVFEKGEKMIQILLGTSFTIKKRKLKGPAQKIQFLGVKWQDGWRQIPTEVINKVTAMSPRTSKKETQAFLGAIGFWRTHIPEYSQTVSPLYLITHKNDFHWSPEQQQAFTQVKQDIAHEVARGPVKRGPEAKNVLYSAAKNKGHQDRDATSTWARDRRVDLTMDNISQVIHDCETCAAINRRREKKILAKSIHSIIAVYSITATFSVEEPSLLQISSYLFLNKENEKRHFWISRHGYYLHTLDSMLNELH